MTNVNYKIEESININYLSKNYKSFNAKTLNINFDEKKTSMNRLENIVYKNFKNKYKGTKDYYNIKTINDIINNSNSHLVSGFKDYLIMGDISEFLQKNYTIKEIKEYLKLLIDFYKISSLIFPCYVLLPEKKYIFKNIRKKQKIINQQQYEIEKNEIKAGENNTIFFNTLTLNSIFNQTNSSNLKLFFGLNKKLEKDNDSDIKKIYKNITKNEIKIKQKKYIMERKIIKFKLNDEKNNKTRCIDNNEYIENINKEKIIINKNKIKKNILNNIFKTEDNNMKKENKIKINIDKNILNTKRDVINNNLELKKSSKLKANIINTKTNTCLFEKNGNNIIIQKIYSKKNNNSKNNIFKKIFKFKLKKKNDQKTSKENIMSLLKSKIRNKSSILQIDSSFNSLFKKNKTKRSIVKHKKSESTTPIVHISTDKNKLNKFSLSLKINESYSSPNIYNLNSNRHSKIKKNKSIKEKILSKVKNSRKNEKISPLSSLLNIFNTINNNINNNSTKKKFEQNLFKNKYNIIKNKNHNKKDNRIIYQSNTSKYISTFNNKTDLNVSSKTSRILKHKKINNNFKSIPVFKKINNVIKRKRNSEIYNNVNINININSNNIYNNLNNSKNIFINHNKNNITINNNNFNKKNLYSLFSQQTSSFIFNKNVYTNAIKKLLSSISNSNIHNNSKKVYSIFNKNNNINNKTNDNLLLSRCLTSRNSINISKIKNKLKKIHWNEGNKSKFIRNILKKEIFKNNI